MNQAVFHPTPRTADSAIGLRLRQLREARGLGLAEVAGWVGVTRQSLWRLESGRTQLIRGTNRRQAAFIEAALTAIPAPGELPVGRARLPGLHEARLRAGTSLRRLATQVGRSATTLGYLERGRRMAGPPTVYRLAVALGVAPITLTQAPTISVPRALAATPGQGDGWGARLRRFRLARGLTLTELAARAGVTPGAVRHAEERAAWGRPHTMRALAQALEISWDELIGAAPMDAPPA